MPKKNLWAGKGALRTVCRAVSSIVERAEEAAPTGALWGALS